MDLFRISEFDRSLVDHFNDCRGSGSGTFLADGDECLVYDAVDVYVPVGRCSEPGEVRVPIIERRGHSHGLEDVRHLGTVSGLEFWNGSVDRDGLRAGEHSGQQLSVKRGNVFLYRGSLVRQKRGEGVFLPAVILYESDGLSVVEISAFGRVHEVRGTLRSVLQSEISLMYLILFVCFGPLRLEGERVYEIHDGRSLDLVQYLRYHPVRLFFYPSVDVPQR